MPETILTDIRNGVATITLNRPEALNALNLDVMRELTAAVQDFDRDHEIGAIVITGSAKAFAAGADIKEMQPNSYVDVYLADWFSGWNALAQVRKPTIAAVSGYALGGGCELAMICDIVLASETARFGQPEVKLGVIPGIGGSQRLTRAVGKAKAMEMCLTGRMMDADESERSGLVSRVIPADGLLAEAQAVGEAIAAMSTPTTMMIKECVNRAFESSLAEGIIFERRVFHATFSTADQKEGMLAFIEKRQAEFTYR